MKRPRPLSTQPYESPGETKAAIGRIRTQFKRTKSSLSKEYDSSPEGIAKSILQRLLDARKSVTLARKELSVAIGALRRIVPTK